ncbi:hypothetical protein PWP93_00690 [Paraburkholderia sp. A1RI-2L]
MFAVEPAVEPIGVAAIEEGTSRNGMQARYRHACIVAPASMLI